MFLKRLGSRMLDRDMTVELTQPAKERLIDIGFDPALGARPLRRAVQHEVEDKLSERILHGELSSGQHVLVDFKDGEFVFTTGKRDELVGAAAGELTTGE
jgi:ATP-dependent Clp protease ATP-binding subunit ClpC